MAKEKPPDQVMNRGWPLNCTLAAVAAPSGTGAGATPKSRSGPNRAMVIRQPFVSIFIAILPVMNGS